MCVSAQAIIYACCVLCDATHISNGLFPVLGPDDVEYTVLRVRRLLDGLAVQFELDAHNLRQLHVLQHPVTRRLGGGDRT